VNFLYSRFSFISSVGWLQDGSQLIWTTDHGKIHVWDAERFQLIRTLKNNDKERIAAISCRSQVLTEGNASGTLRNHDLRVAHHEVMKNQSAHRDEVNFHFSINTSYLEIHYTIFVIFADLCCSLVIGWAFLFHRRKRYGS